ncbi:FCD domain-containing protein [Glycomyces luteolus]|uniref:FCD domain-containing protein n=1 Tax=Glycomyces luteolus TaxID=2670330 RepID=A0A9X3PP43_9ACTN|nr:FCD domain-containing protein [Glycomyces luteolus]MDA1362465.1 FCD domain-containing protein [Glycomyces luteolus]
MLIATLDALWDKADRYRRLGLEIPHSNTEREQKAAEHTELIDYIVAGDVEGAAAVMLRHINTSLGAKAASRLGAGPIPRP